MELVKWYLDVATPDGRCAIVYVARLRLLGVSLHAQGLLLLGRRGLRSRWSLLPARPPRVDGTRLRLSLPALGVGARIDAVDPPFQARLHAAPAGTLDWECRIPRGEAEIRAGGEALRGLGYAERLRVTVPPWELPIRELRWGRLLSPAGGIVWISWDGPAPLRLALRDGLRMPLDEAGDDGVVVGGIVHPLRRLATLRDAPVARTLPAAARRALPRVGLGLRETKWLASGSVGGLSGLAVHEVVRWP
jgi:hypothetical protein